MENKELLSKINEYMDKYLELWDFSGSVLVAKEGEVLFKKGYGYANIEHKVSNTSETKFRIWSITKQFTAVAILMLEEKGLIDVKDSIKKYFPEYTEFDERITIHHLLTHTSGIFNYSNVADIHKRLHKLPLTHEEVIGLFKDRPLEYQPGEGWNYCNSGYHLLGLIIEKVSGKTYSEFLKENIFDPIGMKNTGVDDNRTILPNMATGYYLNDDRLIHCEYVDMNIVYSSGAMYSTVEDMYLWDQALLSEKLIKKESLERMNTPYKDGYGYGVFIEDKYGRRNVNHGGGCEGFLTELHRYIDDKVSIVILSNYGFTAVWKLSQVIAAIVFDEAYELPKVSREYELDPQIYENYMGVYEDCGCKLTVTREGDKRFFIIDDEYIIPFYPVSETRFFHTWIDEAYEFTKDEKGKLSFWGLPKVEHD